MVPSAPCLDTRRAPWAESCSRVRPQPREGGLLVSRKGDMGPECEVGSADAENPTRGRGGEGDTARACAMLPSQGHPTLTSIPTAPGVLCPWGQVTVPICRHSWGQASTKEMVTLKEVLGCWRASAGMVSGGQGRALVTAPRGGLEEAPCRDPGEEIPKAPGGREHRGLGAGWSTEQGQGHKMGCGHQQSPKSLGPTVKSDHVWGMMGAGGGGGWRSWLRAQSSGGAESCCPQACREAHRCRTGLQGACRLRKVPAQWEEACRALSLESRLQGGMWRGRR